MEPPPKRRRTSNGGSEDVHGALPRSLSEPVSPPRSRRSHAAPVQPPEETLASSSSKKSSEKEARIFNSPFQLTWIRDLAEAANKDAVTLRDLLGDPLIAELWEFNYLHDVDYLMEALDEDIRHSVQVHVVHGFWKKEDQSRLVLQVCPLCPTLLPRPLTYTYGLTGSS